MDSEHKPWTVADFMTPLPCTVDVDLTLDDASDRMGANNIRHLLVTRGRYVVGVISLRDIDFARTRKFGGEKPRTIADAMTENVYACQLDTPLEVVAGDMEAKKLGCAIVRRGDIAVGIFTTTDAMRVIRSLISGKLEQPRAHSTHVLDPNAEARTPHHTVRVSDSVPAHTRDGLIGSVGV